MGTPAQAPPQGQPMAQPGYAYGQPPPQGWAQPPMMAAPRPMNWDMFAFLFRMLGFILIAIGALVVVAEATPPACITNTPPCTPVNTILNGLLAGRILFALGALLLGLGAGIKIHWVLRAPADTGSNTMAWIMVERLVNYAMIAVAIALLWFVMTASSPPWTLSGAGL